MIHGKKVSLRPAQAGDRRAVFQWLAASDVTHAMLGPPNFPESHVPTWDDFCGDCLDFYFDGSRTELGRSFIIEVAGASIGHVSYSEVVPVVGKTELDIWMCAEAQCGHGHGTEALLVLMDHLHRTLHLHEFIMRPSRRNTRAIRCYAKAGFEPLPYSNEEQALIYGTPGDYNDTVVMRRFWPVQEVKS